MKKKVIHIMAMAALFAAAVLFFEYMTHKNNEDMMTDIGNATLPRVYFSVEGYGLNPMNGYVEQMDVSTMRDAITPVTGGRLVMNVDDADKPASSIDYAVCTLDGGKVLYENHIPKVSEQVTLTFDEGILGQERLMTVTLHVDGGEVYYYTRVVEPADFHLSECLEYVYNYHENALAKRENVGVGAALEPNDEEDNTSFAHVSIHSDYDHVTWGGMEPQVTGEERWKILESNPTYTSVLLEYEVSCTGEENETDLYMVREFFRVRMAAGTMYLLDYDRTAEQIFDGSEKTLNEKGVLLGITQPEVPYAVNGDGTVVSFVQANELWNYNRDKDELSLVFSFRDAENTDIRNKISDHEIQILNMDKEGNTTFSVTGYMNRGSHEGRVGSAIYYYSIEKNSIEEKAFVPSSKSAAVTEKSLGDLTYYSVNRDYLYMVAGRTLYEVDVDKNWDEPVVENLQEGQYAVSDSGKWIAYQSGDTKKAPRGAIVMNLEKDETYTVEAAAEECVVPLGFVEDDFVYGFSRLSEEGKMAGGEKAVPIYRVEICNDQKEVIMTYDAEDIFVSGVQIRDGMITLNRIRKSGDIYVAAADDYITNNEEKKESNITLEPYTTELKETQMRLTFLDGIQDKNAKLLKPKLILQDEPALPDFHDETGGTVYYVYGLGKLQGMFKKAGEAIQAADHVSGVVISENGQYVWERGNRYLAFVISGQDELLASLQSQLKAGEAPLEIVDKLSEEEGLELTGCSTEQVLYLINKGTPVIGVRDGGAPVILTGYSENDVTYIDTGDGQSYTVPAEQMDQMMQGGGNAYIGYLPGI